MKRAAILVGVGAVMLVGVAGVAYAQQIGRRRLDPEQLQI